ncbi:MAG: response regulator transcription factor [Epsilonproteobacteria bacterium]|nr:response regulator transcription factor [Campylobacterota bacterium]
MKEELENLKKYTVLYAEDEKGTRENIAELLKMMFKKVYVADNGDDAYELYLQHMPDLVITDVKMPGLDGIELAKEIRKISSSTQIIVISAYTDVEYMLSAVELSLIRYIVKPLTETKLIRALEIFLQNKEKRSVHQLADGWIFDEDKHLIVDNEGNQHKLTKKENRLLKLLIEKDRTVDYKEIETYVWGYDNAMSQNALRLLAKNLRKKLPEGLIQNIHAVGYRL